MRIISKSSSTGNHVVHKSRIFFLLFTVFLTFFYTTIIFGANTHVSPTNNSLAQNGSFENSYKSWSKVTWRDKTTTLRVLAHGAHSHSLRMHSKLTLSILEFPPCVCLFYLMQLT